MTSWTRRRLVAAGLTIGSLLAAGAAFTLCAPSAQALENGVARTPPMGWNSWNTFGCNINETLIRQMADAIVSSGMSDLGYKYVVVDDCWFNPNRDSSGNLQGDPSRFPSGMKSLGDYLHGKGLKFGLYEVPVAKTCAQGTGGYPGSTGSQGHEAQDARQFAAWGVDYLKYDYCSGSGTINDQVTTFAKMRDALAATGRPIVYSINPNSFHCCTGPQRNWGDVANMWRTTEDITNKWDTGQTNGYPMGIQNIVNVTVPLAGNARPGAFNDPDMMEVGRGGLTDTEQRSHFALWAMMASPLIAGNDVRSMTSATQTILKNANLIAIDQDSLAAQATQVSNDGTRRVLAKKLANGDVAVALFNQGGSTTTISTTAATIGMPGSSFTLRDVWSNATSTTTGTISAGVPSHGTVVYRVSRTDTPTSPPPTSAPPSSSPPTPPPAAGSCRVSDTLSAWNTGLTSTITITNTGTNAISGWSLGFTLPNGQTITSGWNATYSPSSGQVTARNVSYNGDLAPNASLTIGFQATHTGNAAAPTSFTLNGSSCAVA
ncbi:cellulose binding domain-containing protein [Actinoplanes sp. CA-030573]|uniref:cellulose binding domain-containing protein n=1 Tax=Actinoplanes sp. CA-030573 TaxID=3239898 RepID=UPI003D8B12C4